MQLFHHRRRRDSWKTKSTSGKTFVRFCHSISSLLRRWNNWRFESQLS